ncbi:dicarboxylate/amino acid:cation symporter [Candidatus Chlamydia corallus]|uniref:dicarboxylate/amino acid:cation symporter n=1 Tax=Candidatus Chlamydia corallus TaxID=2038470 RepID=UPI000C2FA6D9|nr:dicarboxylate/amino acid:cation symporter [Candidatus Chlamydia corallus]
MKKQHSHYTKNNLLLLLSILLGLGLGSLQSPWIVYSAECITNTFLKFLRLLSIPLVFCALGSTITSIQNFNTMMILGKRILYYTLLTTLIAASIGLLLFFLLNPHMNQETLSTTTKCNPLGYLDVLADSLPENIFKPFIQGNVISAACLAIMVGTAALFLKEKEKTFVQQFFNSFFSIFLNLARGGLKLLPIAMIGFSVLLFKEFKDQGNLPIFSKYLLCVIGANLSQGLIVLPILLKINKVSPLKIAKAMSPALVTAFFSKSSAATLPLTMELAEDELKINKNLSRFSFPLCSVINMNGCAAFILITVFFVATSNGMVITPLMSLGWVFFATLAAIGNAGVPMGCYFLTLSLLTSMNIPLSILGLILPFYTVLDMIETSLNVWSDCCVVSIANQQLSKTLSL